MVNYHCGFCKYHFECKEVPKKCPYCSREKTIEKTSDAEELVNSL